MKKNKWVFAENPNTMVMTTKSIVEKKSNILTVWHDLEDGMWQFLDGTEVDEEDAMIVSLEYIVKVDNTVNEVHNIPLGWVAWRTEKGHDWSIQNNNA